VVVRVDSKTGGHCVSPFAHLVAHRDQFGPGDMAAAKQIAVAFRDPSTSQQAKPDHSSTFMPERHPTSAAHDLADIAFQPNYFIARQSRALKRHASCAGYHSAVRKIHYYDQ
jgi:hypothetical protein